MMNYSLKKTSFPKIVQEYTTNKSVKFKNLLRLSDQDKWSKPQLV